MRRKCEAWAKNLVERDCSWIIVVHDLDENNEQELRGRLTASVIPAAAQDSVVLIPKREIEAWLLYDARAIAAAFHQRPIPPLPGNPENLPDPKKHLSNLIWKRYHKVYINSLHNALIAQKINIALLKRSKSFAPHIAFTGRLAAKFR